MIASLICLLTVLAVELPAADPIDIGTRRELFVDHALIARMEGRAELRLHMPRKREVAIKYDQLWEGNASGYATVFQDDIFSFQFKMADGQER